MPKLLAAAPHTWDNYHELFFGGGSLFLALAGQGFFDKGTGHVAYVNDFCEPLMTLYLVVKQQPEALIDVMRSLMSSRNQEAYTFLRNKFNTKDGKAPLEVATLMMYLNRMGFNGLWRVNAKGEFNNPYGQDKWRAHRDIVCEEIVRNVSKLLQGANLFNTGYEECLGRVKEGDLVYLDPPYWPLTKGNSFTRYSQVFGDKEQEKLAWDARVLSSKGAFVMLSNNDVPEVRGLYRGWNIQLMEEERSLNCKALGRGKITTLLIKNFA